MLRTISFSFFVCQKNVNSKVKQFKIPFNLYNFPIVFIFKNLFLFFK